MEKVIENFIAYMRETKKASQNTEISYERDLKKLARYLRRSEDSWILQKLPRRIYKVI